jgi:hypothetical protein
MYHIRLLKKREKKLKIYEFLLVLTLSFKVILQVQVRLLTKQKENHQNGVGSWQGEPPIKVNILISKKKKKWWREFFRGRIV